MLNYEFIWDMKPVANCRPFMEKWNSITHIQSSGMKKTKISLPKFVYATADDFFHALDKSTSGLVSIKGERPNVWLYIHGPAHEKALTASRKGDIMLPAAEKIASFNALTDGDFTHYPEKELSNAWLEKIYPDHGWGGKNGDITDNVFLQKYEHALASAENMLESGLNRLASQVQTDTSKGIPVVVFNTLSWKRDDVVKTNIKLKKGYAKSITVIDASGRIIPTQILDVERYDDGSIRMAQLCFIAHDVPSLGYASYYLNVSQPTDITRVVFSGNTYENDFYKITFGHGGIRQIEDKQSGKFLLTPDKYLAGEVITLQSEGNGAGEFDAVQQPTMKNFDKTSNYSPEWTVKETGDVFTSFTFRSPIRHAVVEQTVTIYHQIRKIDFDVAVLNWDGTLYREFRMMLPINAQGGEVAYEVPYGVLRVGKDEMLGAAGERYNTPNKDQHPRGIGNWMNVSGKDFGVTLSSSVAVADYIDPSDLSANYPVIQPILFASRKSCHGEGNEYRQHGDHKFHFSLTSHQSGWQHGYRFGLASNETLKAVFSPSVFCNAKLSESQSFFDIDNENVIVSAIKKCEDDNNLIIRLYNLGDCIEIVRLSPSVAPKAIIKTNLTEQEQEIVNEISLGKYAIETYKLMYE